MIGIERLLATPTDPARVLADTGLDRIDEVTGGLRRGHLWIVTGAPGEGTSLLVMQIALRVAATGCPTALLAPRQHQHDLKRRIVAHITRSPVDGPAREGTDVDPRRVDALPLRVAAGRHLRVGSVDLDDGEVVAIDDADLVAAPGEVREMVERGHTVVLGLPFDEVVSEAGLRLPWARLADVIAQVETNTWAWVRPAGESRVRLLKHRWGPLCEQPVHFLPALARLENHDRPQEGPS